MKYEITGATLSDAEDLFQLSEHLDSMNLPHQRDSLEESLERSERSFLAQIPVPERQYIFLLRDLTTGRALGTSMIFAQIGTRERPHIFFDVRHEERYSRTLDRHFEHQTLSIGYSFHGPTEIGGLVVAPSARRAPERLGMLISYVRFLFIATHRELFQNRVVAELMPPLESDGSSTLWKAVGHRFTGLSYREADKLSKKNKEFIRGLFPMGELHVSLLSPEAQAVVGKVGPQTLGVSKMLKRIGFRYQNRVDPFDGGPHFIALTDEIELVQRTRTLPVHPEPNPKGSRCLVASSSDAAPFFRAVSTSIEISADPPPQARLDPKVLSRLGVQPGEELAILPLH